MSLEIADITKGNDELYSHATTGGIFKYYIATSSDTFRGIGGEEVAPLDPEDWVLGFIRSVNKRVDDDFGLTLIEVSNKADANLIINYRSEARSDYASTINGGLPSAFLVQSAQEIVFQLNIGQQYVYNNSGPTVPKENLNAAEKQGVENRYLHELGHVLGLEHPWDKKDGDWGTENYQEAHSSSRMGYNEQLSGYKYTWYSETDIAALEALWGKNGEVPPILSISPYSKLGDRVTENPTNQIFLANNDGESVTINYSYSDIQNKLSETDQFGNRLYATNQESQGIYVVQHPDIGMDTFVGFSEIVFTDQTITLNIPNTKAEYPTSNNIVISGLTEGAYLKYSLSSSIDSTKNTLKAFSTGTQPGTQNFNAGDNVIIADGQAKTLRGLDGDDTYFISNLLPEKSSTTIIDTSGTNTIQIPSNTAVTKSQWAKDTVRLTFEDSRVITVNNADTFSYNLGGNVTSGITGVDITFSDFARTFGIVDILNLSGNDVGTYTDLYIV